MLSKGFKKYITQLLVLTAIMAIASILFAVYLPAQYVSQFIYFFVPFFFVISIAGRIVLERLVYSNSKILNSAIIGIRVAKFFIYLVVIVLYAFFYRDDAVNFILTFFVFYLIFTFFDIKSTYVFLKYET